MNKTIDKTLQKRKEKYSLDRKKQKKNVSDIQEEKRIDKQAKFKTKEAG